VPSTAVPLTCAGAAAPLDGTLSIEEALAAGLLAPRAKLLVQVHAAPRATAEEAHPTARARPCSPSSLPLLTSTPPPTNASS
jgi:hypothetical protein